MKIIHIKSPVLVNTITLLITNTRGIATCSETGHTIGWSHSAPEGADASDLALNWLAVNTDMNVSDYSTYTDHVWWKKEYTVEQRKDADFSILEADLSKGDGNYYIFDIDTETSPHEETFPHTDTSRH